MNILLPMKGWLTTAVVLLTVICSRDLAAQANWETSEICQDCAPRVLWFTDSLNGMLYAPLVQSSVSNVYRTNTGGRQWTLSTNDGYLFTPYDLVRNISWLDASTLFWKTNQDLYSSTDSGKTWDNVHMFPVPKFLRMVSRENGFGVTATKNLDKEYEVRGIQTTDGGTYWDAIEGATGYTRKTQLQDAIFLDDSTFLFLHANDSGELLKTTDQGKSWTTVYRSSILDAVYMWRMNFIPGTDIVFIETYNNSPLTISFDRGTTWSRLPKTEGFHNYRTRATVLPNQPLHLWAAAGSVFGNPSDDLLNPDFENAYATKLMRSTDTGRSWQEVEIGGFLPGAKIISVIPVGSKLLVAFYLDSVTYLSSLELGDPSHVNVRGTIQSRRPVAYPNPVHLSASFHVTTPDVEFNRVEIRDALSNLVVNQAVEVGSKGLTINLDQNFASGFYTVTFFNETERVETTSVIVR